MIEIRKYRTVQGRVPFDEWFSALRDKNAKRRIQVRIDRLALGLEGDWKFEVEAGPERRLKYLDSVDECSALDEGGLVEYRLRYPDGPTVMRAFAERFTEQGVQQGETTMLSLRLAH